MSCTLRKGDTISQDVAAITGGWRSRATEVRKANRRTIPDLNKVWVGQRFIIPNVPDTAMDGIGADNAIYVHAEALYHPAVTTEAAITEGIPAEAMIQEALPVTETPLAMATNEAAPLPPIGARNTTKKKLAGYRLVIPHSRVYRTDGIPIVPLKFNLRTDIGVFKTPEDPENGIPPVQVITTVSQVRVEKKNNDADVLLISLPQGFPKDNFILRVNGIGSIDGKDVIARATPIYGNFPGHGHHAAEKILTGGTITANGLLLSSLSGNPVIGFGAAVGTWALKSAVHGIRMAALHRAERRYQERARKDLARIQNDREKKSQLLLAKLNKQQTMIATKGKGE